MMRIRAIRTGFIGGQLKTAGQEFNLHVPALFSPTWMEQIEAAEPEEKSEAPQPDSSAAEPPKPSKKR